MNVKGSLPLLILHILSEGPNHGYRIARLIKQRSQGVLDFREGTLYPTLHSLEQQGLIRAEPQIINGRKRRYYHLTPAGTSALADQSAEWSRFAAAVDRVLTGGEA